MIKDFYKDLNSAKAAEQIVLHTLSTLASDYTFEDVSDDREYYHKGDIAAEKNGRRIMIEVKQDGCIENTGNVLCEEKVYYFSTNSYVKGNFYSDYEIYAVVSPQRHKVIFMDFSVLKRIYKSGKYKEIPHNEQITYAYLLPLEYIKEKGGIIAVVDYENNTITYKNPAFNSSECGSLVVK